MGNVGEKQCQLRRNSETQIEKRRRHHDNQIKVFLEPHNIVLYTMRPKFDDLPLKEGDPPFSAWGLYGADDQLGTLNLLTTEVVKEASKEIRTGVRVGLNLPLDIPSPASHNRFFKHEIIHKAPRAVHDDVVHLNTQVRRT